MMRNGRIMLDSSSSRSEMILHGMRIGESESGRIQHLAVEGRETSLMMMRRYSDEELRNFPRSSDQDFPTRDYDTTSKFQWKSLLKESRNLMADGGRRYDELVERSIPIESEMINNVPTNAYYVGSADYRERTRNLTGLLVEDPESHRRRGNVTDPPAEDVGYHRHTRNRTGLPIEDSRFNGRTENMAGLVVEGAGSAACVGNVNGLPVEDADHRRRTKSITCLQFENDGRPQVRGYPQHMDRDTFTKAYEGNGSRSRTEDSPHSLTPHSQSSGQHTPFRGTSFPNVELHQEVYHHHADGPGTGSSIRPLTGYSSQYSGHCQRTPSRGIPSTNFEGLQQDVFHHPSDGLGTGSSIPSSTGYSSYGIVHSRAGRSACPVSNEGGNFLSTEYNDMDRHSVYFHSETQRCEKVCRRGLSKDIYDKYENVQDYNDYRNSFGNDTLDPASPGYGYAGNSCNCALEEDGRHHSDHTQQEAQIVDLHDIRTAQEIEYGGANMYSLDRYLEYQREASHEPLFCGEECSYQIDAPGVSYQQQTWYNHILEEGALKKNEGSWQISKSQDIDLCDQPKRMSKRKRGIVGKTRLPKHRTSTLGGRGALSYDNRHLIVEPDSYRSSSDHFNSKENAGLSKSEPELPFAGLSKELQSRLSKPCESGRNDVKSRLKHPRFIAHQNGPPASEILSGNVNSCVKTSPNVDQTTSAPQPCGKAQRTSVRKRLKRDAYPVDPQVSHPDLNLESQQKLATKNSESTKEVSLLQEADVDHSILKVKSTEKDPPENSAELKHQVDHWFLKCMLYLNANMGRQKKFKEQGKAGPLKCIICSSSKEFLQTKDVATHAFTSLKIGLRAQHLGFHRALCVLMGWDTSVASNDRWICKSLPDVQAWAMKDDIIVWPPVVIIHNGSPRDLNNSNEQVKISIEQLEDTLKDMGLSEGKTTICRGKPGNPNIMLVKFNGTLSGLQEAERLHNVFSEKKRGRAELQERDSRTGCHEGVVQEPEAKIEDVLYGYLGIVEDFDKLNYDMRRHCFAKSRKNILACVDKAT
ncbi:uncharacterized protein LOC104900356 [Beta vulgaris subsp. vulgaris]|uniref:uncharacterized protein LOC104900356 n=1 Tax=Beta vulgaris subsp. vulgaris TaxID=3555 RepID=UPI0020374835|nr:uncharacterized protein LOC104900356 [Beta vulgaris subsp. vulgaris]